MEKENEKQITLNQQFLDFVERLEYLEVCRITITPDGTYDVPGEHDGRIARVSLKSRKALAKFCRKFARRLEKMPAEPSERRRRR